MEDQKALNALGTGYPIVDAYGNRHFAISEKCQEIIKNQLLKQRRKIQRMEKILLETFPEYEFIEEVLFYEDK